MPRLAVVFDTNCYRSLGRDKFDALRAKERSHGILAYASYSVIMEFLAHVGDPADPATMISAAALRRLWTHCKQFDGSSEALRLLGDPEAQVPVTLFHREPAGRQELYSKLGYAVRRFSNGGLEGWPEGQALADAAKRDLAKFERQFADDLFRAVSTVAPGARTWFDVTKPSPLRDEFLRRAKAGDGRRLIAAAIVAKSAAEIGMDLHENKVDTLAHTVETLFPLPIRLYDQIVQDVVEKGINMSRPRQSNSLWDYQICFSVGSGAVVKGAGTPIWLVTSDQRILDAAESAGGLGYVQSMSNYERILDGSTDDLDELIGASFSAA